MRRKILMGVLAAALPVGTLAMTQGAAFAGAPDNPITCGGFGATVTFGTPLTVAGVPSDNKLGANTSVGSTVLHCAGGVTGSSPALNIAGGKNTKAPKGSAHKYITGTWSEFAAAGGGLKKSLKTIQFGGGTTELFKAKGSSIVVGGSCGGDVGFTISGQVKGGTYPDKNASILACLGADTHSDLTTGTFLGDYLVYNGVISAQIDPVVSTLTI